MRILEALVFLTAIAAAYAAIRSIRATIGESPFLFLRLLTFSQDPLPSFIALLGFLIPLVAIALSFDAINGEFNRRTMSRILAQPIYRDALLLGKFFAGLLALTIGLISLWLLVLGLGLLLLGLPPSTEETVRMLGGSCEDRYGGRVCQVESNYPGDPVVTTLIRDGVIVTINQTDFPTDGLLPAIVEEIWGD